MGGGRGVDAPGPAARAIVHGVRRLEVERRRVGAAWKQEAAPARVGGGRRVISRVGAISAAEVMAARRLGDVGVRVEVVCRGVCAASHRFHAHAWQRGGRGEIGRGTVLAANVEAGARLVGGRPVVGGSAVHAAWETDGAGAVVVRGPRFVSWALAARATANDAATGVDGGKRFEVEGTAPGATMRRWWRWRRQRRWRRGRC